MATGIGNQLRACGRKNMPEFIRAGTICYRRVKVFKHDFGRTEALFVSDLQGAYRLEAVFQPFAYGIRLDRTGRSRLEVSILLQGAFDERD